MCTEGAPEWGLSHGPADKLPAVLRRSGSFRASLPCGHRGRRRRVSWNSSDLGGSPLLRKGNGLLVGVTNFVKVYLVSLVAMETLWSFKVGMTCLIANLGNIRLVDSRMEIVYPKD